MNILLITWACDKDDVSEPKVASDWVREISKRYNVTLFSISRPERYGCVREQFPEIPVVEWKDIYMPKTFERFRAIVKPGYFLLFGKMRIQIKKLIKSHDIDLIHHLNPFAWRYPSPAYGLGIPLIKGPIAGGLKTPPPFKKITERGLHLFRFLRYTDAIRKKVDTLLINSYRQTDCVIGAAPYVFEILKPISLKRTFLEVELGVAIGDFNAIRPVRMKKSSEKIILLFVGRVVKTKGLHFAIQAISKMIHQDKVEFVVFGDGDELLNCRELVSRLQLETIVKFRGWCKRDIVAEAYKSSDIFLFPSFREPTGGVLLEAMIYGLPIITCDYGGPSFLVSSEGGIKVAPCEINSFVLKLAQAIDLLVLDSRLRIKMGEKSRVNALKRFEWGNKMDRIDTLYRGVQ